MKKLIIIHGCHLDEVNESTTSENYLIKLLSKKEFIISNEIDVENIVIYKSKGTLDNNMLTHIIIGFDKLISKIHYYSKSI